MTGCWSGDRKTGLIVQVLELETGAGAVVTSSRVRMVWLSLAEVKPGGVYGGPPWCEAPKRVRDLSPPLFHGKIIVELAGKSGGAPHQPDAPGSRLGGPMMARNGML